MTSLCVPFINTEKQDLETALELGGARFDVQCANWPETFPYTPFCSGRVARTKDALVVDFRVSGLDLRAQNTEDNGRQWEDSCVEVFIKDPEKADYYNFEINALGKVLASAKAAPGDLRSRWSRFFASATWKAVLWTRTASSPGA